MEYSSVQWKVTRHCEFINESMCFGVGGLTGRKKNEEKLRRNVTNVPPDNRSQRIISDTSHITLLE